MKSVNEKRERMHLELALAVTQFEMTNKVTVCKAAKTPKSRKVGVKSKLVFGPAEPKARPSNAWDVLLTA